MKLTHLLSLAIATTFAFASHSATTYNLSNGNVTVPDNTTATVTQSNSSSRIDRYVVVGTNSTVTLTGINVYYTEKKQEGCVVLKEGSTVILNGAKLQSMNSVIRCMGNATIIVADGSSNVCTNNAYSSSTIYWPSGKTLKIKGQSNGTGTLLARNYYKSDGTAYEAAAIGSCYNKNCGSLIIEGGKITAVNRGRAAAIGGISGGAKCGNITIKGGSVTAQNYCDDINKCGSGIGDNCGNITITGGTVVARGGAVRPGIGGPSCGDITISGGNVTAYGDSRARGGSEGIGGGCGAITITGGTVTSIANGGSMSQLATRAGIGGNCGAITIANTVTKVVATKARTSALDYIGKSTSSSTVGTISLGNKLKKTYSGDGLTLTLQPAYTITWKNDNGTVLETDKEVLIGTKPEYNGGTPTKLSSAQYDYTFAGWSPNPVAAYADAIYTATFDATVRNYEVAWIDEDTVLRRDTFSYGDTPIYDGNIPINEGFSFAGWFTEENGGMKIDETTIVTGNTPYYAQWTINQYTVTFDANGGTGGTSRKMDYGSAITAPVVSRTGYIFAGWSEDVASTVPGNDVTYYAQWERDPIPELVSGETVAEVLEGSADETLAEKIGTTREYKSFRGWVEDTGLSHKDVKESPNAWLSYALDAPGLIGKKSKVVRDDIVLGALDDSSVAMGNMAFAFGIDGAEIGEEAELDDVFSVEGTTTLEDSAFTDANLTATLTRTDDGKVNITVSPPKDVNGKIPAAYFFRVKLK